MTNKMYDALKWVALVLLPALGALYFTLGQIWHFPAIEEVVGSVAALDTFLGLLVNKSSKSNAEANIMGDLVIQQDIDGTPAGMRLVANRPNLIFEDGKHAVFQIKREQSV